jgi:putative oxygen-independent coproporphyrinogen III oxidase
VIPHLYVHVPFCPTICPYCDFHVLERKGGLVEAYLRQLEVDAAQLVAEHGSFPLKTLYVGGGTPSFLRDAELEELAKIVRKYFGWASLEATLEVNPGTVNAARAAHWRDLGFTRVSVGVQSTQDAVLKFLGRTHNASQALDALETLQGAGFAVSADLITAVPHQDLAQDIGTLGALGLDHISCYTLTIEEGTPFYKQGIKVTEEAETLALETTEPMLAEFGLLRYEVSNHAKTGFESKHNLAYWQNQFFYGLGAGAAGHYPHIASESHIANESVQHVAMRRTNPFLYSWLEGNRGQVELISRADFITDALFNGLRLRQGVNIQEISNRAGLNARTYFANAFEICESKGWLEWDVDTVRCTKAGWWVLNKVIAEFLVEFTPTKPQLWLRSRQNILS